MDQLLSGLYGALIATILSIIYLYFSDQIKLRSEVMLEVVGYSDDIYKAISEFPNSKKLCKNMMILGSKRIFSDESNSGIRTSNS